MQVKVQVVFKDRGPVVFTVEADANDPIEAMAEVRTWVLDRFGDLIDTSRQMRVSPA